LKVWKFVKTLANRDIDDLFRFVTDPEIDPTNNISERELRSIVLIRKISFGSRSTRGANATAFLMSILQTMRLKGKNPLTEMLKVLDSASGY